MSNFTQLTTPTVPIADDVVQLRLGIVNALQALTQQINNQQVPDTFNMQNQRVANVATPASQYDAANKAYVDSKAGSGGVTILGGGGGGGSSNAILGINLVCDGDSLTAGFIPTACSGGVAFLGADSPVYSYPGQLQSWLSVSVNNAVNLGANGVTSSNILATHVTQLPSLYKANALNVYMLMIGINDFLLQPTYSFFNTAFALYKSNIAAIVTAAQAAGFKVIIGTITQAQYAISPDPTDYYVYINGGINSNGASIQGANPWLLANTVAADIVINVGDDPIILDPTNTDYFGCDKLHMLAPGYGVVATNFLAGLQRLIQSWQVHQPTTIYAGDYVRPDARKASESLSVEDFGASTIASATQNTTAILAACAAAQLQGKSVRFPSASYAVNKFNLMPYLSAQGLRLWSDCNTAGLGAQTILACTGSGASWLKGCLNVAPPNSGNTAVVLNNPVYGVQLEGLAVSFPSGSAAGLYGFWLVTNFAFEVKNCAVIAPAGGSSWAAGISLWQCGLNGKVRNFSATKCSVGISLNGPTGSGINAWTASILVENPQLTSNTVGLATPYAQYCQIRGGYYISNGTGFVGNGNNIYLGDGYFSGNTVDVDMVNGTDTWTVGVSTTTVTQKPYAQVFQNNYWSTNVNLRSANNSVVAMNYFGAAGTFTVDASCTQVAMFQHNSAPVNFTDSGVATYFSSVVVSAGTPVGVAAGISGQEYFDKTANLFYVCATSGLSGVAVWKLIGGGASGVTSLNSLTGVITGLPGAFRYTSAGTSTLTSGDMTVAPNAASGTATVRLAAVSSFSKGAIISIADYVGSNGVVKVEAFAGDTIQGLGTITLSTLGNDILQADGTNTWILIGYSVVPFAGAGMSVGIVGNAVTYTNTGQVTPITAGSGIAISTTAGTATLTYTGAVAAGTGIAISSSGGTSTVTNTGYTGAVANQKLTFGVGTLTTGTKTLSAADFSVSTISSVIVSLIEGPPPTEYLSIAFNTGSCIIWSSNAFSNLSFSWQTIGAR